MHCTNLNRRDLVFSCSDMMETPSDAFDVTLRDFVKIQRFRTHDFPVDICVLRAIENWV